jgi:hypothetical protein
MLASAHSHQLAVQVRVRDSAGHTGSRQIELIQFTTRGAGPQRSVSSSPTIEVLAGTDFASGQGHGSILAACHAAVRCHVRGSLSVGGTGIATVAARDLGANEVGYIPFRLTSRGQALLARAQGNQLGVQVKLSNGGDVATGQIALVRYS